MNNGGQNRRQLIAMLAGAAAWGWFSASTSAAQQSPDEDESVVTTGISGNRIAWMAPWVRDGRGNPIAELALTGAESGTVVGSHAYDAVTLLQANRATMEFSFVPLPEYGMRWTLPSRWNGAYGESILDEGGVPGGRYVFSFFAFDGVEYGRWSTILSPAYDAMVDTRSLVAPVTEFGSTLAALLAHVSLNNASVFDRLNPAVLQRMLNPLVGTALATDSAG